MTRGENMDVLEEIKKEHKEFKTLIKQIESSDGDSKKELFKELYAKVKGHHEAEEHVVFPDVKEKSDDEGKDIVLEMIEEHHLGTHQLSILERISVDNETWNAKFSVLKEVLTHHMEEEEKDLFDQAKKVLSKEELKEKYQPFEDAQEKYEEEQKDKLK